MQGIGKIGNSSGQLYAKKEGGNYYWCIDCDVHGQNWEQIPKYLYNSLIEFSKNNNKI